MGNAVLGQKDQGISDLTSLIDAQIAQVARQAAHEAVASPKPMPQVSRRPFASYRALCVTWLLCLGLTVVNLESGGLFVPRSIEPSPASLVTGLETLAAMDAVLIEEYEAEHGLLPLSLSAVGLPDDDPTLEYQRTEGQSYRVIARHGKFEGVFDSRLAAARRTAVAEQRAAAALLRAAEQEEQLANAEHWLAETEMQARAFRQARGDFDGEGI